MIFEEIIEEQHPKIERAVENLFKKAKNNQTHPQDLLLVISHVFQNEKFGNDMLIGPGEIGHAEQTQYEFYDWYRNSHMERFTEYNNKKKMMKV